MPVAQCHWQPVESAAFRSWPFKIPSGDLDGIARKTFPSSHLEPVRVPDERLMVTFLSDAPAWPRFLPRHAHSKGGM